MQKPETEVCGERRSENQISAARQHGPVVIKGETTLQKERIYNVRKCRAAFLISTQRIHRASSLILLIYINEKKNLLNESVAA